MAEHATKIETLLKNDKAGKPKWKSIASFEESPALIRMWYLLGSVWASSCSASAWSCTYPGSCTCSGLSSCRSSSAGCRPYGSPPSCTRARRSWCAAPPDRSTFSATIHCAVSTTRESPSRRSASGRNRRRWRARRGSEGARLASFLLVFLPRPCGSRLCSTVLPVSSRSIERSHRDHLWSVTTGNVAANSLDHSFISMDTKFAFARLVELLIFFFTMPIISSESCCSLKVVEVSRSFFPYSSHRPRKMKYIAIRLKIVVSWFYNVEMIVQLESLSSRSGFHCFLCVIVWTPMISRLSTTLLKPRQWIRDTNFFFFFNDIHIYLS